MLLLFQLRDWSAIYSAPGGANGSEPKERLQRFETEPLQWFDPTVATVGSPIVTTVGSPTDAERSVGGRFGSGAGLVRVAERVCSQPIPMRPDSKRTKPGREPEPEPELRPRPRTEPEPGTGRPAAAAASGGARMRAWFPPNRARKLQVPKGHALCSQFSLFKHYKLPSHGQCGTKCF